MFRWTFKRWRRLFVLAALFALIWFAPAIAGVTPLKQWILDQVFADLKGSVRAGQASLGWLSPITLDDAELRDADGRVLFAIPKVRSSQSLIGLLLDRSNLGAFYFERPAIHIVWDEKQTNLETTLAAWLYSDSNQTTSPAVRLEVQDAQLVTEAARSKEKRTFKGVQFSLDLTDPLRFAFSANEGDATVEVASTIPSAGKGEVKVRAKQWALGALTPLVCRFAKGSDIDGTLNGSLTWTWDKDAMKIDSDLIARGVKFSGSAIGSDKLHLDRLEFPCTAKATGNRLVFERAEIVCDVGKASLAGSVDLATPALEQKDVRIIADVDLARLANLLPDTLRLRKDTRFTSGKLTLDTTSQARDGHVVWQGKLRSSDLQGTHQGQNVSWQHPVAMDFSVYRDAKGLPVVERLKCDSSFLQVDGSGTATAWTAKVTCDLEQLLKEWSRFADVKDVQLAGKGWFKVAANQEASDRFKLDGEAQMFNLSVLTPAGWIGAGAAEISGRFRRDAAGIDFENVLIKGQNVRLRNSAVSIADPTAEVRTAGRWQNDRIELKETTLSSTAVGANFPKIVLAQKPKSIEATARGSVRGDLARLQSWFQDGPTPTAKAVVGNFSGVIDVKTEAEVTTMTTDLKLQRFGFASSTWRDPEVRIVGSARLDVPKDVLAFDKLQIETPALTTEASGKIQQWATRKELSLAGQVRYDLQKLEPHLRALLGTDVKVVGRDTRPFQLQGPLAATAKPMAVTVGQSASQAHTWTGEFGANWQSLSAFKSELGAAEIKARLAGGVIQFQPIDTAFNHGRFRLHPKVLLDSSPAEVVLEKSMMVDKARLTAGAAGSALHYVLPVLAGVTESDGLFSVHLDSGRIPLGDTHKTDLAGQIHIHDAKVGPSPFIRELSTLLIKGNQHFSIASNSVVPFQVVKGRVYHRDLEIIFPEIKIRTHGSVGFDGTLALTAEMPIPPKWLGSGTLNQALAKQTIKVPIGGTLDRPRLDQEALRTVSLQVMRDLGTNVLQQELENRLKNLFPLKK